ncbi:hypothetical protein CRYUN_Cryun17cG0060800 [Craigia yunnanensis]
MVSEDFSFPKITNPFPQLTSLPSLWRVSSLVYPEYEDNEEDVVKEVVSFQMNERDSDDPEKMDMLWEEFNEELKRVSSLRSRKDAQALKMTKTGIGSGMIYHKQQSKSMLATIKTLKKIFFLRNLVWIKN